MAECLSPIVITPKRRSKGYDRKAYKPNKTFLLTAPAVQRVPCGKCAFCLQSRRAQWMFRIHHEMRTQRHPGWFLTLTYDEKHVPRSKETGRLSLRFYDVQLYLKRLRKAGYYAKYISVGEYGSDTHRPHYHMLLWTDAPTSFLQDNWKASTDGSLMGNVHFGVLTMASAMYTLKYIIQPKVKEQDDIEPTRAQFSKGIGLCYLTKAVYHYHTSNEAEPVFTSRIDGVEVQLPRYYQNKIFTNWQRGERRLRVYEELIDKRSSALLDAMSKGAFASDGMTYLDRLKAARRYLQHLRVEENNRILKSTKFNQTL